MYMCICMYVITVVVCGCNVGGPWNTLECSCMNIEMKLK